MNVLCVSQWRMRFKANKIDANIRHHFIPLAIWLYYSNQRNKHANKTTNFIRNNSSSVLPNLHEFKRKHIAAPKWERERKHFITFVVFFSFLSPIGLAFVIRSRFSHTFTHIVAFYSRFSLLFVAIFSC